MINGTKLLNVARISRGRRDGILKGEKIRKVVKVGAMNNKGVWIPFERALEIAQREEILDSLYPLFVVDLTPLLYSPSNLSRLRQLLSKGVRKNPGFQRWFEGIPPIHNAQSRIQHMQQSLPRPQQGVAQYGQPPAYQTLSQSSAGPGPSATATSSRSHRRTRSQQHQALYRGSSVQKQHRQRREQYRGPSTFARYPEGSQVSSSTGNWFQVPGQNLPGQTQSQLPAQQQQEREEPDLSRFHEQPQSQAHIPPSDSETPPAFHPPPSS